MKILLITDTHGELAFINALLAETGADCCVHCGDFGFYDARSIERLTERELRLRLRHSDAPGRLRKRAFKLEPEALVEAVRELGLLEGLVPYIEGRERFLKPVYAVWGNHEDIEVVRALRSGDLAIGNLSVLDERRHVDLPEGVRLLGLGGNFYLEGAEGLMAPELVGRGGQVRASWPQYARLLAAEGERASARTTIFVSHVSPGKARVLERYALVLGADIVVSGHMDPPTPQSYSLFAICEPHEAMARSRADFEALRQAWDEGPYGLGEADVACVEASLEALDVQPLPPPRRGHRDAPGSLGGRFRETQFLNLADTPGGYAVLEIEGDAVALTTSARFRRR